MGILLLCIPQFINAQCQASSSDFIEGTVYRDYNSNGEQNSRSTSSSFHEPGVFDILVKAFDNEGNVIARAITDYEGNWALDVGEGTDVRIEFTVPDYLKSARLLSGGSNSMIVFETAPACDVNIGVYNPSDFCQDNPEVISACFNRVGYASSPTIISIDYNDGSDSGTDISAYQETTNPISISSDIGTIWGMAYNRRNNKLFASRYYKPMAELGTINPSSTGVIFSIDNSGNVPGVNASVSDMETTMFMDFGAETGAEPSEDNEWAFIDTNDPKWSAIFSAPGKIGLGDTDISDDGETLYTINLNTRQLYTIPIGPTATAPTEASVISNAVGMPAPTSCSDVIRPFGLKFYDGLLYIGMVCTGENQTAGSPADYSNDVLKGYVYSYDPVAGIMSSNPVLEFPFNYDRGTFGRSTSPDSARAEWNPWIDNWEPNTVAEPNKNPVLYSGYNDQVGFPQPIIADIEFDNGDMVLSILDRFGEQLSGFNDPGCNPSCFTALQAPPAGDMLRAGNNGDGTWTLESNATVESVFTGTTKTNGRAQQAGPSSQIGDNFINPGGEYYHGDWFDFHSEVTVGGLGQVPGQADVIIGAYDVSLNYFLNTEPRWGSGGLIWMNNRTGDWSKAFEAYFGGPNNFNKGNGFADVETLCQTAPIEVGNRVWNDADADGIQDPSEAGIPNVTIHLYKGSTLAATTMTDADGHFLFNNTNVNLNGETEIELGVAYTIVIDNAHYAAGAFSANGITYGAIAPENEIAVNSDHADRVDSDAVIGTSGPADGLPNIEFTINNEGNNTHALDFGFGTPATIGDLVWFDANEDGTQDNDGTEPGIPGVKVTLYNAQGIPEATTITDGLGQYSFTDITPGSYRVGFSDVPTNYVPTTAVQGGDVTMDSDIDAISMIGPIVTVNAGENNESLDSGFYRDATKSSIGNYVWEDTNNNGIQDVGESPLAGVEVSLYDNLGMVLATTYTNEDGNYLFTNLNADDYAVGFEAPVGSSYVLTQQDQGTIEAEDSDAFIGTGQTGTVMLAAATHNSNIGAGFYNNASVAGVTWIDANANGIQELTEDITSNVNVSLYNSMDVQVGSTQMTGVDGSYLFTNVPPGDYYVSFDQPTGYERTDINEGGNDEVDSDADLTTGNTMTFTVSSGDYVPNYDAGFFEYATIGDFMFFDSNIDFMNPSEGYQGTDDNTDGINPLFLAGVDIHLYDEDGDIVATQATNASGIYSFTNVKPGTYVVGVDREDMQMTFPSRGPITMDVNYISETKTATDEEDSDLNPNSWKTLPFKISSGETNNTIDLGFDWVNGSDNWLGNYAWEDTNKNGLQDEIDQGIANVQVTLFDANGNYLGSTATDAEGFYFFSNVLAGDDYQVTFGPPAGYIPTIVGNDSDINETTYDATVTNLIGGENDLDAGFYRNASVGNIVWEDYNANGIQDAGEPALPGVWVSLYDNSNSLVETMLSDPSGHFEFTEVSPGTGYYLEITVPTDYILTSANVSGSTEMTDSDFDPMASNQTAPFDLVSGEANTTYGGGLYKTAQFGNYVWVDTDGDGIQDGSEMGMDGVTVSLHKSDGTFVSSELTAGGGFYQFTNVTPGDYYVTYSNYTADYVPTWKEVGLSKSMDSNADRSNDQTDVFSLNSGDNIQTIDGGYHPPLSITGYVWEDVDSDGLQNETGKEIESVPVSLYDENDNLVGMTNTIADGTYEFTGLAGGMYYVVFGNAPGSLSRTAQYQGGNQYTMDSDANPTSGQTQMFSVSIGVSGDRSIDAGYLSALPVSLIYFKGSNDKCENILKWATASEQDNWYFDIERSDDGERFQSIGKVDGNGTSSEMHEYSFVDQTVKGNVYYRLRQVDFNGNMEFAPNLIYLTTDCYDNANDIRVYPNPANQSFALDYESGQNYDGAQIQIINNLGKVIQNTTIDIQRGENSSLVNINHLAAGVYMIRLRLSNDEILNAKLVKAKN